eukprot:5537978-Lingulodinium_polyedra.AAC.1
MSRAPENTGVFLGKQMSLLTRAGRTPSEALGETTSPRASDVNAFGAHSPKRFRNKKQDCVYLTGWR